jgi:hypothetical protein
MKSILSRDFKYVPSGKTDLKRTFARIRKQLAEQQAANEANRDEAREKVKPMRKVAK